MNFQKTLLTFLLCLTILPVYGQWNTDTTSVLNAKNQKDLTKLTKNWPKATGLILGTNLSVWGFDRFVVNGEYARINLTSMKNNFRQGFVWDNDMFVTNLFAHPYHGGLYFNAARSNGMNFWESVPFAAGGSWMWEFFMENEYPAINDFLATSIGGASLGEMTFRLSDQIIDDRTFGFDRFKREALLTLISPIRGIGRIINGDAWKHRLTRGNTMPVTPIVLYTNIGHRYIADILKEKTDFSDMMCIDMGLNYGNPYDQDNEKPYDYFSFKVALNVLTKQPIVGRVNALGMLYSKDITLKKPNRQLAIGLYQHFNYYQSKADINNVSLSPYKISEAASVGPGLIYQYKSKRNITFLTSAYLSAIFLGGSQTDHYKVEDRDYNMGSGFSSKLNFQLLFGNKAAVGLFTEDYRIYSWVGYNPNNPDKLHSSVQGDKGNASLSVARLALSYVINNHFLLSNGNRLFIPLQLL